MAVQLYGLPPFSPQVTYQNISWGTASVNFEVPTFSLLEIMTNNNWSTGDEKKKKKNGFKLNKHIKKRKKKEDKNKDIKESFLHVFGWNYSQNYSTAMNHQDTLALFQSGLITSVCCAFDQVDSKQARAFTWPGLNDSAGAQLWI